jgi:hypothetical protein
MSQSTRRSIAVSVFTATVIVTLSRLAAGEAIAQSSPLMQQKVAEIRASLAKNEQMVGQYTWQQQESISVRGDLKKEALYQMQLGANGQPVRTDVSQSQPASGRKWGIRHRITQDYIDYGKQVAALAQSYAQPNPDRLQQLYAAGNVSLKTAGAAGLYSIVVRGYVKPGDTVTVTFSKVLKALVGVQVNTYLSGPSDGVTITVGYAQLPDGTNHVATINIDGQSKSMTIVLANVNYQKR